MRDRRCAFIALAGALALHGLSLQLGVPLASLLAAAEPPLREQSGLERP